MHITRRRSTAWVAGLAYFLASALSGLLHQHAHDGHGHAQDLHSRVAAYLNDDGAVCAAAEHARGVTGHVDEPSTPGPSTPGPSTPGPSTPGPSTPGPLSDDDCLACRFVTQSAVVSVPSLELTPRPIVAEVRVSAPQFFIEPVYSNALARAPPLG